MSNRWADICDSDDDFEPSSTMIHVKPEPIEPEAKNETTEKETKPLYTGATKKNEDGYQYQKKKNYRNPVQELIKGLDHAAMRNSMRHDTIEHNKETNQLPESTMFFDRETDICEDRWMNVPYSSIVQHNFQF